LRCSDDIYFKGLDEPVYMTMKKISTIKQHAGIFREDPENL